MQWRSPVGGGGLSRVDENVVLLELLDVTFDLVHLLGERLHLGLLAQSVQLSMVGLLLVLLVQNLPLLFKGTDQLVALRVGHQELLAVLFVLLLNLHLSD